MNDPADGDLDLHFSGVGSATLAQKHVEDRGIINDLEQLPVQNGLETADREGEREDLGFLFSAFYLMKFWAVCLKQAGGSASPPHGSVVAPVAQPKTEAESLKALQRGLVSTGGEIAMGLGSVSCLVWVGPELSLFGVCISSSDKPLVMEIS